MQTLTKKKIKKLFIISAISRENLLNLGYNERIIKSLDDKDMVNIALKIGNCVRKRTWLDLRFIIDNFIKNKN